MTREKILVIEDEPGVLNMTVEVMRAAKEGYVVEGASSVEEGLAAIRREKPSVVLLDLNLGRRFDGLEVCKRIRENPLTSDLAVIVLTGELMDAAETMLLDAGADDYIRKPHFTPQLLESRVRAVLRRTHSEGAAAIERGPLTLYPGRREALLDGEPLCLTPTEFDIVYKLADNPERALARRELLDRGGGGMSAVDRTVDVHVLSIRRKLGKRDWLVQTVFGTGYRIGMAPDAAPAQRESAPPKRS
jgi:DNA-binding response OmpR family regulator